MRVRDSQRGWDIVIAFSSSSSAIVLPQISVFPMGFDCEAVNAEINFEGQKIGFLVPWPKFLERAIGFQVADRRTWNKTIITSHENLPSP